LWSELGKEYSVLAIGQAGENLVKVSVALVDKASSIGKGGLPAVMAAKNLKAVAVKGTGEPGIANRQRFEKICGTMLKTYERDPKLKTWKELGKMWFGTRWNPDLKMTHKNFTEVFPVDRYFELYGEDAYLNQIKGERIGCDTCTYPCKDLLTVNQGPYQGLTTHAASLIGRVWNLGLQCASGCLLGEVSKLLDVANRYGIDCHTFTPLMGLAVELYERNIITDNDTEGMELRHDFNTTLTLIEKTAFRQGIGAVLADGVYGVFDRFGEDCEKYSTHIKGMESQHVDARTYDFSMMLFTQVTNPQGSDIEAAHVGANMYPGKRGFSLDEVRQFCERMGLSKEAQTRVFDAPPGHYNTAYITPYAENFFLVLSALGICEYMTEYMDWEKFAELYSSITGLEMSADAMKKAGDRIWNLWKLLNAREGFSRKDDRFPARWLEHLRTTDGRQLPLQTCEGRPVSKESFEKMLDEYYSERGWDIPKGLPTKKRLTDLGLANMARDLETRGVP
jgi:aldehyde:ferredoxin oxidoreductase